MLGTSWSYILAFSLIFYFMFLFFIFSFYCEDDIVESQHFLLFHFIISLRVACFELLDTVPLYMLKTFFKLLEILGLLVFEMKLFKSKLELLGVCLCLVLQLLGFCRSLKALKVSVFMDCYSETCHTPQRKLYLSAFLFKKNILC